MTRFLFDSTHRLSPSPQGMQAASTRSVIPKDAPRQEGAVQPSGGAITFLIRARAGRVATIRTPGGDRVRVVVELIERSLPTSFWTSDLGQVVLDQIGWHRTSDRITGRAVNGELVTGVQEESS